MRPGSYDDFAGRLERDSARAEAARQAADDRASEPHDHECADCGAPQGNVRRCTRCGGFKVMEITP